MVEKKPSLSSVLAELRKKEGVRIGSLSDFDMVTRALTTGNLTIDALTGCGGLPRGRVVELYGAESSGKTTTALQAAAALQQEPGCNHTAFWDHENSLDEQYVRALGIDPDAKCEECKEPLFLYEQPRSFEAGANLFRRLMPFIDLLITDSVAAMTSEHELSIDTGKVELGVRGRLMYQYMRQVIGPISRTGSCMVFLNHVQDVIDTSPMGQQMLARGIKRQTTPGGRGLKFYASLRMEFKRIGQIKTEAFDPITNTKVKQARQTKTLVAVTKNKVGDPFGTAEVRVRFGRGFSNEWSALDVVTRHGMVKKDGSIYRFPALAPPEEFIDGIKGSTPWIKGEENVVHRLEQSPAWRAEMVSAARELIASGWDQKLDDDAIKSLSADEDDDPSDDELDPSDALSSDELDDVLG